MATKRFNSLRAAEETRKSNSPHAGNATSRSQGLKMEVTPREAKATVGLFATCPRAT
jgi:hypothetical protein